MKRNKPTRSTLLTTSSNLRTLGTETLAAVSGGAPIKEELPGGVIVWRGSREGRLNEDGQYIAPQ